MVKLSPDNQNAGWQAGYDPIFESIGGFSHIHEWTMAGLLLMPFNGELKTYVGDQKEGSKGYRSAIAPGSEEAPLGYYKVKLADYDITAELTSTTRCGFQRYTFPREREGSRVIIDLKIPAEYSYELADVLIKKTGNNRIEGYSKQHSPNTWSGGISQDYIVHFVIEFDKPFKKFGVFTDKLISGDTLLLKAENLKDAGAYVEFDTKDDQVVQVRSAISYVSTENAAMNLMTEISGPFGWDFDKVRRHNLDTWNDLMGRVQVASNDRREKSGFIQTCTAHSAAGILIAMLMADGLMLMKI